MTKLIEKLVSMGEAGAANYRESVEKVETDRSRQRVPIPPFDYRSPRKSLVARAEAAATNIAIDELETRNLATAYEHASNRRTENLMQEADLRQLREEAKAIGKTKDVLTEQRVKDATNFSEEAARLGWIASNIIRHVETVPNYDKELSEYIIASIRRSTKGIIDDLELNAMGFDGRQIGGAR